MFWSDEPENKEWNVEKKNEVMRFLFVQDASGRMDGYKGGMRGDEMGERWSQLMMRRTKSGERVRE